jgi:hypothetical protein
MKLTKERKTYIDCLTYEMLLSRVRFAKIADPWFQGETGDYWLKRVAQIRNKIGNEEHSKISKRVGW